METKSYYIYILANDSGTLYTGVTGDLAKRIWEHKQDLVSGFTRRYRCHNLVYTESRGNIISALERESEIKYWRREKKEDLINSINPGWKDLSPMVY